MQSVWQHLPENINPIALTVGFFSLYWYALFLITGVFAAFLLAHYFVKRDEAPCTKEALADLFLLLFFGALVGGRIGYVLFYNFDLFLGAPLSIIVPYDFEHGVWTGISGMSYHGGWIGVILSLCWFTRTRGVDFWKMADFVALLTPVAIFFGRLGNFFNIELYGRVTTKPWGMFFPNVLPSGVLRHPSTLYEAFLEGMVLFIILILFRKKMPFPGALACLSLVGYAVVRFAGEYFREPDSQIGLLFNESLSLGQILSLAMFFMTVVIFMWLKHQNRDKMLLAVK
jgi:phosphatidylglycerol:prolipoprotein diacylglycerol transferase